MIEPLARNWARVVPMPILWDSDVISSIRSEAVRRNELRLATAPASRFEADSGTSLWVVVVAEVRSSRTASEFLADGFRESRGRRIFQSWGDWSLWATRTINPMSRP